MPVRSARERLARQAAASALWVELDGEFEAEAQELLAEVNRSVSRGDYVAVVSVPWTLIDPVAACIAEPRIELIIDADDQQRAAAIAIALSGARPPARVSDVAADKNAARLRQLSEEVNRIASTLARLSTGPAAAAEPQVQLAPSNDVPAVLAETMRTVIRARRLRARYFQEDLFADPAWDMLLALLQAEISQLRVPVEPLHRRSSAGDDSASVVEDAGPSGALHPPLRSPRRTAGVRGACPRGEPRAAPLFRRSRQDGRDLMLRCGGR